MNKSKLTVAGLILTAAVALLSGCATPLNSAQKSELHAYQAKGLEVQEKTPQTGAVLGILPGCGSFYARQYGLGVVNLLVWPFSILWDPVSGYEGSQAINYYATKAAADKSLKKEMSLLDDKLTLGQITKEEYIKSKRELEAKYSADL